MLISPNILFPEMVWHFSGIILSVLVSPKLEIIGFGSHGHVRKSEDHEDEGFSGFTKMNPKSDWSKMKQNNSTELLGYSFNNI